MSNNSVDLHIITDKELSIIAVERNSDYHSPSSDFTPIKREQMVKQEDKENTHEIDKDLNAEGMTASLRYLQSRQRWRLKQGHYQKSPGEFIKVLIVVLLFMSVLGLVVFGQNIVTNYVANWSQNILVTFSFPIICYILIRLSLSMRWVMYWLILYGVVFLVLSRIKSSDSNESRRIGSYVFVSFFIIQVITVAVYFISRTFDAPKWAEYLFSKSAQANPIDAQNFSYWTVTRNPKNPGEYFSKGRANLKKMKFSYRGEVNSLGQPHGHGIWTSQWQYGEVVRGYWVNGEPVGPFRSREWKTGDLFEKIRIGIITCGKNFTHQGIKLYPLRFGVSTVECSVSGKFFHGLPRAELLLDPFEEENITQKQAIGALLHLQDLQSRGGIGKEMKTKLTITCYDRGFSIPGYTAIKSRRNIEIQHDLRKCERYIIKDWLPVVRGRELMLFIPGFNSSAKGSSETFGQLLGLGGLPSRIKPFIFFWPGGSLVQFYEAIKIAESKELANNLMRVLRNFGQEGFTKVHILTHSMGARVFLNAATQEFLGLLFKKVAIGSATSTLSEFDSSNSVDGYSTSSGMELASLTFVNPEAELDHFRLTAFKELRPYCSLITMYGNRKDLALRASAFFTQTPILGLNVDNMHNESPLDPSVEESEASKESIYLDMDVIDGTNLESNVALDRHSYFKLNKYVIDDLIDIVLTGARAEERENRLVRVDGNVFAFLSAPSFYN